MPRLPLAVIPGDDPPQFQGSPQLDRLRREVDAVLYRDRPATAEEQIARAREAEIIVNSRSQVRWPGEVLRDLPRLRLIVQCAIGVDGVDLAAARRQGVTVCNVPGRTAPVVAEHALGLMLAAAKRVVFHTQSLRAGRWLRVDNVYLNGKRLGIVGTGNIGARTAQLARAIGMEVVAWTFNPTPERERQLGVRFVPFDELLRTSDVVSLHVRLTGDTQHMIGARALSMMKRGALLVNVARGGVVDTAALVEALRSGHLGGAALDVFEEEPLPPDSPILQCEQVVLTPHCADTTPEGVELLNEGAVDNVIAWLEGRPQNVVT